MATHRKDSTRQETSNEANSRQRPQKRRLSLADCRLRRPIKSIFLVDFTGAAGRKSVSRPVTDVKLLRTPQMASPLPPRAARSHEPSPISAVLPVRNRFELSFVR